MLRSSKPPEGAPRWWHALPLWLMVALCTLPVAVLALRGVSLGDAWVRVLSNPGTWAAAGRSVALTLAVGAVSVVLGLPAAWLVHGTDLPRRNMWRIALALPLAVPSYVSGFVVVAIGAPGSWLSRLLALVDLPPLTLGPWWGTVAAMAFTYPLAYLPILAAMSRVDASQWEAARTLGATPLQAFRTVVWPAIRGSAFAGGMLSGLYALGDFGAVSLLRFDALSYRVYVQQRSLFGRDDVIPLAALLVIIAVALTLFQMRVGHTARSVDETARVRTWPTVRLGPWRAPAIVFVVFMLTTFIALPITTVVGWLLNGLAHNQALQMPWEAARNTLGLALGAGLVVLAAGIVPALWERFVGGTASRAVRIAAGTSYALPGIVVAITLVAVAVHYVPVVYQTWTLLVFAYLIRFLPIAQGGIYDAINSVDGSIYEAARTLGATPRQAVTQVIVPAAKTALIAAYFSVAVAITKELPAALLLGPIGADTLATRIWTWTEDAYYAYASVPTLLLVAAALAGLLSARKHLR